MKPNLTNTIITKRKIEDIEYYELIEAGSKLDSAILNWFISWALKKQINISYQINGGINYIGKYNFVNMMNRN